MMVSKKSFLLSVITLFLIGSSQAQWKTVGYGGGGAMFYPQVSPFNPEYAFVSCDMTGSYVTHNGGASWQMFNLHNPTTYYVFDPIDSNTVYANSIALFKSSNRGKTWSLFYPSSLEVTGLVSQGDHAREKLITRDNTIRHVQAFAIDPNNSRRMFAVIDIDKNIGLYYSNDGGMRWTKENDLNFPALNIFVVPNSPEDNRTLYITHETGVTARNNRKFSFSKAPTAVNKLMHFTGGYDAGSSKFILYAIAGKSYFDPKGTSSGIFYSEDGGVNWDNREAGITKYCRQGAPSPEWRTIATSAHHPGTVYVSYNRLQKNADTTYIGVAKSDDYGQTWSLDWKDVIKKSGNVPSENFKDGWINERFGPTWGENPFSIGVAPNDANIAYASDFGRTVKTTDGGKTWEQVYTDKKPGGDWKSRGLEVTTGYLITADPFDKQHLFMCNTDIGLMASNDGGDSWKSITKNNGVPRKWQNSTYWVAADPEVKGRVWAAMTDVHDLPRPKMFSRVAVKDYKGGVMLSNDNGKTWKESNTGMGEGAITHVLIDENSKKNARTLYACSFGKGVYKSTDDGKTWKQKNKGIEGNEPFVWRITQRKEDGVLFLVVCRRSEDGSIGTSEDGAMYRSDDKAETWKKVILPEGTNGPMSIVTDGKRILLSAWGRDARQKLAPDTGGGIFVSEDEGSSWKNVLHRDQHIHDITYDPRNNTYYACGFNGSAYRSTDGGISWKRIKGYNFKWGKRVDPDPNDPDKIYVITFGGGLWHGPATGDPNAVEDITTPVLKYKE